MYNAPSWLLAAPFAHRGLFSPGVPENSRAAFEAALARGYAIELDLRLLADGQLVVFHDADLARLTGRPGRIEDLRSGALRGLSLDGTGQPPPLLDEVLALVGGRAALYLEMKPAGRPEVLAARLAEALAGYAGPFAAASFDPRAVAAFARLRPDVTRGLIASPRSPGGMLPGRLAAMALCRPHFVSLAATLLPSAASGLYRVLGRPVLGWTARSPEEMARMRKWADNVVFEGFLP